MKKLFGIISIIIYFASTNALTHASMMWILPMHQTTMDHCHHTTETQKTDTNENNECHKLVRSNEYFTNQIEIPNQNNIIAYTIPTRTQTIDVLNTHEEQQLTNHAPPGQNTDNKYSTFSNLFGIIKKTL